jgi:hypothetical protein
MRGTITMKTIDTAAITAAVNSGISAAMPVELHLDVESTSLRGQGFAFGGFVRQGDTVIAEFAAMSREAPPSAASG